MNDFSCILNDAIIFKQTRLRRMLYEQFLAGITGNISNVNKEQYFMCVNVHDTHKGWYIYTMAFRSS